MAYSITYPWDREQHLKKKSCNVQAFVPGLYLIAAAVVFRILVPEADALLTQLLHPLTDAETLAAVGEMTLQLKNGIPVAEAVTAFCLEILTHG